MQANNHTSRVLRGDLFDELLSKLSVDRGTSWEMIPLVVLTQ
jgi:hypothetical protein